MPLDPAACYEALRSRDARFDGRLFVGVTSTGIYCRPVCRVRLPRAQNCRWFGHAAAAESAGFRPCLRCRPELAPSAACRPAPVDAGARLAWAAAQQLEAGAAEDPGLAALAQRLGVSDRHLRRVFRAYFGVTPVAYAQTCRLLLAKQLLVETDLPITEVALAAGFGSLRRFHALFGARYRLAPGALRRQPARAVAPPPGPDAALADDLPPAALRLVLTYRPPLHWDGLLRFLGARAVDGVEALRATPAGGCYLRTLAVTAADGRRRCGWVALQPDPLRPGDALQAVVAPSLLGALPAVLAALRRLADLGADPAVVDRALGALAADAPGLRVPGAVDGFEMAVRVLLGQQVSVAAARTLIGRLVRACGEALPPAGPEWPVGLTQLFPTPARLAGADPEALGALGLPRRRVAALQALARAVRDGSLDLSPAADPTATLERLQALPGIGAWTAQTLALRALAWPDAWPRGDGVLTKALGAADARAAEARAEIWRPWRGYAALHLWRRAAEATPAWSFPT
ncbi:MAG: helix-turn-helix domain-containing protein [Burkholderiaceae bacterium]|nr:helix-turn-helix domain-containing protein [Burkholderiaceae bacterium]